MEAARNTSHTDLWVCSTQLRRTVAQCEGKAYDSIRKLVARTERREATLWNSCMQELTKTLEKLLASDVVLVAVVP